MAWVTDAVKLHDILFPVRQVWRIGFAGSHLWQWRRSPRGSARLDARSNGARVLGAVRFDAIQSFRVGFGAVDAARLRSAHPGGPNGFQLDRGRGRRGGRVRLSIAVDGGFRGFLVLFGRLLVERCLLLRAESVIPLVKFIVRIPLAESFGRGIVLRADHAHVFGIHVVVFFAESVRLCYSWNWIGTGR